MKREFAVFCIIFICLFIKGNSQVIPVEDKPAIQALIDSSDYYLLKDPAHSLYFAIEILQKVPYKGNELIHVEALLNAANSEKMLSRTEEALRYAEEALDVSIQVDDREVVMRSYYMKATIFSHDDDTDSALIYYQKAIDW